MRTQFSEFTYGYAVMQETEKFLTKHAGGLTKAPVQPSLIKENIVGYDAKFVTVDFAVLLQFKVPDFISRRHPVGGCGPAHCSWGAWGSQQHYRFEVDTRSNQYLAMSKYEREIAGRKYRGLSCYVTPAYWEQQVHDMNYLRGDVLAQSAAPLPSQLSASPAGEHRFSYQTASGKSILMSEPHESEHVSLTQQLVGAMDVTSDASAEPLDAFVAEHPVTQYVQLDRGRYEMESAQGALNYLQDSAALLGAAFVLMGRREANRP